MDIDTDGWFHTGDIGEMVEGKFLKITDRKKEIFKTSGGKYIIPQMMENKLGWQGLPGKFWMRDGNLAGN